MNQIKQFFLLPLSFFLLQETLAAEERVLIEPIYGIETSLVQYPEPPRYRTRAIYGGRVLYGITLLSGELEYTEAASNETYPSTSEKVDEKSQRLAIGVRSTFALANMLGVFGRVGGRATQGETKVTTAGVSETHQHPLVIYPYAGAGLQFAFASHFALNAGVTLIQNAEKKYDSQYTLGLTARFGRH